jgi:superfamily II DNA or RNA helicase
VGRQRLRAWQTRALARWDEAQPRDFLVTATPGSGKTTFALTLAARLKEARRIGRVIVVCPTDHLRTQWADAAEAAGIFLDPSLPNTVGPISPDYDGAVFTYAQVAGAPMLHRRRAESVPTLVILDEIHHAGDGLSWGDAVLEAYEPAKHRLALTGTPFRTSESERIPFVRYEDADLGAVESVADFAYGYKDALADNVVRPVMFAAYSGVARWRNSAGEVLSASLSDPASKDEEMAAWRTALDPAGKWVPHVVAAADLRLTEIRAAGMADAGAMMLASDQDAARAYAAVVEEVTGEPATVVLSDDPKASQKIAEFSEGTGRWLVAVRMVSEGVDVPRLAVGVWATSYRTPLFFAQAVGRFVRARRPGETATVFLPAVRPLLALAATLEEERNHVIAPPKSKDDLLDPFSAAEPPEAATLLDGEFEALDAEAEFAHVLYGGAAHTGDIELSDEDEEFLGLPGLLSADMMAAVLKRRETDVRRQTTDLLESPARAVSLRVQIKDVRREINSLVAQRAARTGKPHAQVHAEIRRAVPGPPSASASLDLLERRRDHLLGLL